MSIGPRDLTDRLERCARYKRAPAWQKPFLNPLRFLRNQARRWGIGVAPVGTQWTVRAFHTPEFHIVSGEGVSDELASYGFFEEDLTEAFIRLVQPNQVVVDIGMHLGYYSTLFVALVGPKGSVHSFEPTPSTRTLAMANVGRFPQVTVHPYAVWSKSETVQFRDYGPRWMAFNSATAIRLGKNAPEPSLIDVRTISLDEFRRNLGQPIHLLKVDAEGAEHEILLGARALLATDRPLISLEMGDGEGKFPCRDLITQMEAEQYVAWEFRDGRFRRHTPELHYGYVNLIFAPRSDDLSHR